MYILIGIIEHAKNEYINVAYVRKQKQLIIKYKFEMGNKLSIKSSIINSSSRISVN